MLERGSVQACRPDSRLDQGVGSDGGRMCRLVFSGCYPFRVLAASLSPMTQSRRIGVEPVGSSCGYSESRLDPSQDLTMP